MRKDEILFHSLGVLFAAKQQRKNWLKIIKNEDAQEFLKKEIEAIEHLQRMLLDDDFDWEFNDESYPSAK